MKKLSLLILVALVAASVAMAQTIPSTTGTTTKTPGPQNTNGTPFTGSTPAVSGDVLGAHNGYGRGCVMCHTPHGGANGNGATGTISGNGSYALWGQNLTPFLSLTSAVTFTTDVHSSGTTVYSVTLPGASGIATGGGATIVLLCLSCHDGLDAPTSMMKGKTYETLPIVGGNAPTWFGTGTSGNTSLSYINEHPVGPNAVLTCSGTAGTISSFWDCTGGGAGGTTISPGTGSLMAQFLINNAASLWNYNSAEGYPLATFGTTANAVTCTTCHNEHSMNAYRNTNGTYATMFFINGYYNPNSGGNNVAQFCRNCHAGESNEASGLLNIPTT